MGILNTNYYEILFSVLAISENSTEIKQTRFHDVMIRFGSHRCAKLFINHWHIICNFYISQRRFIIFVIKSITTAYIMILEIKIYNYIACKICQAVRISLLKAKSFENSLQIVKLILLSSCKLYFVYLNIFGFSV